MSYIQFVDKNGLIAEKGSLRWPKDPKEDDKVLSGVVLIDGDLKDLPVKHLAAARLCLPVSKGHTSTASQVGVIFLKAPVAKGAAVDFKTLPGPEGTGVIPKQPAETPEYTPAKVFPIDVTRAIRAISTGEAKFNGLAVRVVPNRSVDDGHTAKCDVSSTEKITLQIDVYTDKE
jgi:hypothetical protein